MNSRTNEIVSIPLDKLKFDPENPRLPSRIDSSQEDAVLAWMLADASLIELMGSIGEHGYFAGEPLLVVQFEDGLYTVVEGNRRLAAVKLLDNPGLAPSHRLNSVKQVSENANCRPNELPCVIYDSREDILDYLGYRHITGVKSWGALAKAKYLQQLWSNLPSGDRTNQFRALARLIGSRADYVAKLLTGYALVQHIADHEFFAIPGLDEGTLDFSVLTTALSYEKVASFLGLDGASDPDLQGLREEQLQELTRWIFEKNSEGVTRLGESRNLKTLSAVVASEKALTVFRQGKPLEQARLFTKEPLEAFRIAITEARDHLQTASGVMSSVDEPSQSDADILTEAINTARDLRIVVRSRLADLVDEEG